MELTQQEFGIKKGLFVKPDAGPHKACCVEFSFLDYREAWNFQRAVVDAKINNTFNDDAVMVLEHPPVMTIGRHAKRSNLLVSEAFLAESHIRVIPVDRGGDITYHGPGQLIVYLILDLKRAGLGVQAFVEKLEEIMLRTSVDAGVSALRNPLNRGVWAGDKKIGSVGIAVRRGVSYHGFALNVNLSITPFQWINPCGLDTIGVTTLQNEQSRTVAMNRVRSIVKRHIQDVFSVELIRMGYSDLKNRIGKTEKKAKTLSPKTADTLKRKPGWLKRPLPTGPEYETIRSLIRDNRLHTVCRQAKCPNQFECYSKQTAAFLILGNKCTRNCRFCAIEPGPRGLPDPGEPQRVAEAATAMNLDYVVVTSVTRDDLPDGGAALFAKTIMELRKINPALSVEVLIPDFQGNPDLLNIVLDVKPDVLNHNIETVPRLYNEVRPGSEYHRSIRLLKHAAATSPATVTKSGIMLGLGEADEEIEKTIQDVHDAGCSILTIGQYLQPSKEHLEVRRYVHPDEFTMWREKALDKGFLGVASGPFVRSSYHAKQMLPTARRRDA